jgi:hypothetical protein
MPPPLKIALVLLISSLALLPLLPAYELPSAPAPRPFTYRTDTFAFANETVWNYVNGSVQPESPSARKREYTRHCFVLTRAAVQFWKFARFDPDAPPLPPRQLAHRIRQVTERSVWLPALPRDQRPVFPGYANLRAISAAEPGLFQANIGAGWPVYFRAGNMPIVVPVDRSTEARLNGEILGDLAKNYPTLLWLYNFPSLNMNHVVVVFAGERDRDKYVYQVYDPNYATGPKRLEYDGTTRTFSYQPTFYFKGGTVTARAIYRGVLQ